MAELNAKALVSDPSPSRMAEGAHKHAEQVGLGNGDALVQLVGARTQKCLGNAQTRSSLRELGARGATYTTDNNYEERPRIPRDGAITGLQTPATLLAIAKQLQIRIEHEHEHQLPHRA